MDIGAIVTWVQTNWVGLVAALWAFEQFLRIISPITPWTWDDNIVTIMGKLLQQFFPKK